MSLINKMLQDLDARGTPGQDAFPSHVKPVAMPERRAPALRLAALSAGALLVVAALGWFAWERLHAAVPAKPAAVPAARQPATLAPGLAMTGTVRQLPATKPAVDGAVLATAAADPDAEPVRAAPPAPASKDPAPARAPRTPEREHAPARAREVEPPAESAGSAAEPKSVSPMEPDSAEAREARRAAAIELATRQTRLARLARLSAPTPGHKGALAAEGRQESGAQRAENEYGRALASLQDGRMTEALASLQAALRIDPGHDAARQTLVGLLVEAKRFDDAMRELEGGLARDPRQPALAMLLARLQIERGGSGIETLMRSLPYAGSATEESAEYHAFLAGALQRQGRQREAAEQYQEALRTMPGNGVWWMGLGISLQADKRNGEALDAFQKARASGALNAELQAFVQQRIGQLGR
jgi:MSHA biogenesis protein MshN